MSDFKSWCENNNVIWHTTTDEQLKHREALEKMWNEKEEEIDKLDDELNSANAIIESAYVYYYKILDNRGVTPVNTIFTKMKNYLQKLGRRTDYTGTILPEMGIQHHFGNYLSEIGVLVPVTDLVAKLKKISYYLEHSVTDASFDMGNFRYHPRDTLHPTFRVAHFIDFNNCGTVGCALGWAPHALDKQIPKHLFTATGLDFFHYCREEIGIEPESRLFSHLFDARWAYEKGSTRMHAIERINKFCDELQIPRFASWDANAIRSIAHEHKPEI